MTRAHRLPRGSGIPRKASSSRVRVKLLRIFDKLELEKDRETYQECAIVMTHLKTLRNRGSNEFKVETSSENRFSYDGGLTRGISVGRCHFVANFPGPFRGPKMEAELPSASFKS